MPAEGLHEPWRSLLDIALLKQRYRDELRWQLGNPEREDLTLELWLEMISELRSN